MAVTFVNRQRLQDQRIAVRARKFDCVGARQRVQRSRRSGAPGLADRPWPCALPAPFIVLACSRLLLAQLAKGEGRKTYVENAMTAFTASGSWSIG
jgi:hypothetical protein